MSSLRLKLVASLIVSASVIGLNACGGAESDSSNQTAKVEKVTSNSRVKLDPTNTESLLKTFNQMLETQTEDNRFKITTAVLILAAGHDPKDTAGGSFYSFTKGAAALQTNLGTPLADSSLRGSFSSAANQYAPALKGLSDSDLINIFNETESLAISSRKEKLVKTIAEHQAQIKKITEKSSALEKQVEELAEKALGPDNGFTTNVKVTGGRVRGTSILDLYIAANLINGETTYLSTFPTFTVKVWPKGHPAYVIIEDSKVFPTDTSGTVNRDIKTVPPGESQTVLATLNTSNALFMFRKVTKEKGREPIVEDFDAEVRFNSGTRFNNPRGLSGGKNFRAERDNAPLIALRDSQKQFMQCENLLALVTRQLEMYENLQEKFETDNSPRGNYSTIQTPDFDDPTSQQCLG